MTWNCHLFLLSFSPHGSEGHYFGLSWAGWFFCCFFFWDQSCSCVIWWPDWGWIVQDGLTHMAGAGSRLGSLSTWFLFVGRLVYTALCGVLRAARGWEGKLQAALRLGLEVAVLLLPHSIGQSKFQGQVKKYSPPLDGRRSKVTSQRELRTGLEELLLWSLKNNFKFS